MFTGIIEAVGQIQSMQPKGGDVRLYVRTGKLDLGDVKLGDSIAVNGVCLTAVELPGDGFWADVSQETIRRTALSSLKPGSRVNLEKALTPTTRLGGHLVSGHVDGVGTIKKRSADARSIRLTVSTPPHLKKYIAAKGSVTIDGVSLTANALSDDGFELNIVPHTAQETTLTGLQTGSQVHLEVDIIARYLEQLLTSGNDKQETDSSTQGSGLSQAFLMQNGFWK